jgi:hypothetical protein
MESLHSYLYLKLVKMLSFFLFNKVGEQEGGTGSTWLRGGGYTHVSKCKNDKRRKNQTFLIK